MPYLYNDYNEILQEVKNKTKCWEEYGISSRWFSDTFLYYCKADNNGIATAIQQCAELFFHRCIADQKPVVGCLAYGDLYADDEEDILLGPGLIEAYQSAEQQDWIGLIVTDDAKEEWAKLNDAFLRGYVDYDVPLRGGCKKRLLAFRFARKPAAFDYLGNIRRMKDDCANDSRAVKKIRKNRGIYGVGKR